MDEILRTLQTPATIYTVLTITLALVLAVYKARQAKKGKQDDEKAKLHTQYAALVSEACAAARSGDPDRLIAAQRRLQNFEARHGRP